MKQKETKQRLFEVMSRLDKTFKPKLNEDWDNYHPDAPWNQTDEDDSYEDWYLSKSRDVILNSKHGGTYEVDWEFLIPNEQEFEQFYTNELSKLRDLINSFLPITNAHPDLRKFPELIKKIDVLVDKYLQSINYDIDWTFPEPDFDIPERYS